MPPPLHCIARLQLIEVTLFRATPKHSLWCRGIAIKFSFKHWTVICQDKAPGNAPHYCAVAHTHHPGVPAWGRTSAVCGPSRCPGAGPHGSPGTWWLRWALGPGTGFWPLSWLGSRIVSGVRGLPQQSSVSWHILQCRKRKIYTHTCPNPLFPSRAGVSKEWLKFLRNRIGIKLGNGVWGTSTALLALTMARELLFHYPRMTRGAGRLLRRWNAPSSAAPLESQKWNFKKVLKKLRGMLLQTGHTAVTAMFCF